MCNNEQFDIDEPINKIIDRFKPRSVNDLSQDELDYYDVKGLCHDDIQPKLISKTIKRDLKTHKPLEFYFCQSTKINYRKLPKEVDKKLWHLKMDPLLRTLPNNDKPWLASWYGPCELCGIDPHSNFLGCMCYVNEKRFLCSYHIRCLKKFNKQFYV
jgi:hypothetical protein